jgi:hypothetical protein
MCLATMTMCSHVNDGQCISNSRRCDTRYDCSSIEDEINCGKIEQLSTKIFQLLLLKLIAGDPEMEPTSLVHKVATKAR